MTQPVPLTIVGIYAPTNCSSDDAKDVFYEDLNNTISKIPKNRFVLVCGRDVSGPGPGTLRRRPDFVLTPTDKAGQTFAVICKQFYLRSMLQELELFIDQSGSI